MLIIGGVLDTQVLFRTWTDSQQRGRAEGGVDQPQGGHWGGNEVVA